MEQGYGEQLYRFRDGRPVPVENVTIELTAVKIKTLGERTALYMGQSNREADADSDSEFILTGILSTLSELGVPNEALFNGEGDEYTGFTIAGKTFEVKGA